MDFSVNEDERALAEAARRVAEDVLTPRAAHHDETGEFVGGNLAALAALGFLGVNLPSRYGGIDASSIGVSLIVEEIAAACAATCSSVTAHFLATDSVLIGGTDAQREAWLPAAARGETLGAFALTEPGAGSNPAEIATTAERTAAGWRIRGTKHFITNASHADFVIVYAKSDPAAGPRGISAFYVPAGTPGLVPGRPEPTMGLRGSHIAELSIACEVPCEHLLGAEGRGFATAMAVLDRGRVEVSAMGTGIARAALQAALDWVKERRVGGQALAGYQGIQWALADLHVQLEAARLLMFRAATLRDAGDRFTAEAAAAKLFTSEAAGRIADAALQLFGGYGYTRALPLERYVRDARILRIFEGTSEVQRTIIARQLLG